MTLYRKHVFVCENFRDQSDPRGSCSHKGSREVREKLKEEVEKRGLKTRIRINTAGCLSTCNQGVSMVIYPQAIWYGKINVSDIDEIVERSLVNDEVIDRLVMPFMRKKSGISSD